MDSQDESPLMLDRTYVLADGHRVRVRLARSSDARAIRELAARRRLDIDPLDAARLVRFDPRRRLVISATALIDSHETFVGIAAADVDCSDPCELETLIFDERIDGLGELLASAIAARARAICGRSAA
jgi:N-acetylglutamate synthase-like GNAT family acetyltransferase